MSDFPIQLFSGDINFTVTHNYALTTCDTENVVSSIRGLEIETICKFNPSNWDKNT